mgnify:CR=1 FL=1
MLYSDKVENVSERSSTKRRLLILGAGESGCGAAVLAVQKGYEVLVSDAGTIKPKYLELLQKYNIPFEHGGHIKASEFNPDEVVKSPGIPDNWESAGGLLMIEHGNFVKGDRVFPVISEIEFAARYTNAKMVCITGSNGKTTTTSLIYDIFKRAGLKVGLAGNIGHSLALQAAEDDAEWYVIELSSFQLDNMYDFKADIAVLMNITPDHLDRYDFCFQNYVNSKFRITGNQSKDDFFIYWNDDPVIAAEVAKKQFCCKLVPFDIKTELPLSDDELSIKGKHNRLNATAATLAARAAGIGDEVIAESLKTFAGVEHRLQYVDTIKGIRYINDSKATNVDSCWYALDSMQTPTVLILGGKDKGNDYSYIDRLVNEKCRALVFMGLHNEPLHEHFDGRGLPIADTDNISEAVKQATRLAQKGDTVLLSPCCASFDLFTSYEDRGKQFMREVRSLCS